MSIEKGPKESKKDKKLSRRRFLKILPLTVLILSLKGDTRKEEKKETRKEFSLEEFLSNINRELSEIENTLELELSKEEQESLEKEFKELKENLEYLAYPIKAYFLDNPLLAIDTLWEEKNERIKDEELVFKFREIKLSFLTKLLIKPKGYIKDLEEFKDYIEGCITEALLTLDLENLFINERYKFDEEIKSVILEILQDQTFTDFLVKSLLTLILVEICHTSKGAEFDKRVLTYILQKYGLRFLSSIPAVYDDRLSLGPFQLTDLVIGENKEAFYPINFINNFVKEFDEEIRKRYNLPQYKLPTSLEKFEIRHHFKAEVYLLLFYLLELFRKVPLEKIKKAYQKDKSWFYNQLCFYFAGCHHLPSSTQNLFDEFLNNEENIENKKSFVEFANRKSTNENLIVYLKRFKEKF